MVYTIGEMAKMLGVPASTLRYYDKEGLLPSVARSSGGIRQFRESDIEWLRVIGCMKKAGMSIKDIRQYLELSMQGNNTIDTRLAMFRHQREVLSPSQCQNTMPSTAESRIIPMGDGAFCRIFLYPQCTSPSSTNTAMARPSGAKPPAGPAV